MGTATSDYAGNSFYGYQSGMSITTGTNNSFFGFKSGLTNTTGTVNTIVGASADVASGNLTNAAAIGANDKMILGDNKTNVGIGLSNDLIQLGPQKKLEINDNNATTATSPTTANASIPGTFGASGLRFRNLTSATPTTTNGPGLGVLSVNSLGDVILVKDQTGTGGGGGVLAQNGLNNLNTFGTNPLFNDELGGPLLHNTTINNNGSDLTVNLSSLGNFVVRTGSINNVLTGSGNMVYGNSNTILNSFSSPSAFIAGDANTVDNIAIQILGSSNVVKGNADIAIGNGNSIDAGFPAGFGNFAIGHNNTNVGQNNITMGHSNTTSFDPATGTMFVTAESYAIGNDNFAYNGRCLAIGNQVVTEPTRSYMVSIGASSSNASGFINTYFTTNGAGGAATIDGVGGNSIPAINVVDGNMVGIKMYNPSFPLDVNGTIRCVGAVNTTSDSTLKTNIQPITTSALQKVKGLRPISFEWINKLDTAMYGTQYGFTAQQVATVIPDLVKTDKTGKKSLNYSGIIPFLTKALQEQQVHIEHQDSVIQQLVSTVNGCCASNIVARPNNNNTDGATKTTQEIKLSLPLSISISEARPNPNNGKAEIDYYVPSNTSSAKIIFNDMMGRTFSEVTLVKGYGTISVDTKELPNGIYSYTLLVDGKTIDTKKMMKQD
jgi:hypothetical protein